MSVARPRLNGQATNWNNRCFIGDVREGLRSMAADGVRVQMCVTSPPYW